MQQATPSPLLHFIVRIVFRHAEWRVDEKPYTNNGVCCVSNSNSRSSLNLVSGFERTYCFHIRDDSLVRVDAEITARTNRKPRKAVSSGHVTVQTHFLASVPRAEMTSDKQKITSRVKQTAVRAVDEALAQSGGRAVWARLLRLRVRLPEGHGCLFCVLLRNKWHDDKGYKEKRVRT
jgi:hypothetical protein